MWKKWTALGLLVALLLAGCGGNTASSDPLQEVLQAEEGLTLEALGLASEAERAFADLLSANSQAQGLVPQAETPRPVTVVRDSDWVAIIALPERWSPADSPEGIFGQPQALTIKCTSDRRKCFGFMGVPDRDASGTYRMAWYGERNPAGQRNVERLPLSVSTGPAVHPCLLPFFSWKKSGNIYVWDGCQYFNPARVGVHLQSSFPSNLIGQELTGRVSTDTFSQALNRACCRLPKPFEVDWPPAILLRGDIVLAFLPYRNPRLREARSVEELLNQPLGIAYLRVASGGKLTKADAARLVEIKLLRAESDYHLVATDLKDPTHIRRIGVGEVDWCDGCFGQDPPPRYLGIEDRLTDEPLLHLQVGSLLLRGIEKKDIRRSW